MIVPYISREDVSAALSSLVHITHKPAVGGLQHLLLVDLLLIAPDRPESDEKRAFAVQELLTGEISRALHEQCALFRLSPPGEYTRSDEIHEEADELIRVGKHHLLVWCTLYYRYVRSDLGLSAEELAQLLTVNSRTVSRYLDDGINLLTQRLIQREQAARRAQIERRLYSLLPYSVPITLIGRQELLEKTGSLLATLSPCHILITGTTGVGKTAFVQELLRRQIAVGNLDQLVWLDAPVSAKYAWQQITEQLLHESGEVTLRDYLLLYRVVVVLDGLDFLSVDRTTFNSLLRDLGAAAVILINRAYIPIEGIEAHLLLPEIEPYAANRLVNAALELHANVDSEHRRQVAHNLYQHIGGNPLALRLAAGLWENSKGWDALTLDIHERLFGQLFAAFNEQIKIAWCAFALLANPKPPDKLGAIWNISTRAIHLLRRHGLIEGDVETGYSLVGAAREYIRQVYPTDEKIQHYFARLLTELNENDLAQEIFEQILITDFPNLSLEQRANYIGQTWKFGLMRGHWAKWQMIFEDYMRQVENVELEIRIAYGVCLRRLADWESAQQVFYNVSLECGRNGFFAEQARALIEWSIVAKYQGEYGRAQALIVQTKRYAERARDDDLLHEAIYQETSILIEQGNGTEANELLAMLPESQRRLMIQSEAQLVIGNQRACRALAEQALKLVGDDQATEASLYTIIGRSYQEEKAYEQAHIYLTDAVTLLQRLDDIFRLARAQTNLAAVLIALQHYADAGMLLTQAMQIQSRLGDKVGLSTTRHNQSILGRYIAR